MTLNFCSYWLLSMNAGIKVMTIQPDLCCAVDGTQGSVQDQQALHQLSHAHRPHLPLKSWGKVLPSLLKCFGIASQPLLPTTLMSPPERIPHILAFQGCFLGFERLKIWLAKRECNCVMWMAASTNLRHPWFFKPLQCVIALGARGNCN